MKVPFVDLSALHRPIQAELRECFERVLSRNSFVLGPEVEKFETNFASYLGSEKCVAVNSGTAALHLVLLAMGIGPGDEVITVPNTFIATAEAISAVGAKPVFVDIDPISYNMDPEKAEKAITPRTKALLPVHLYGQCADMDALLDIGRRRGIPVVEDACQAHGAEYKGKKAGTMGVAGCFSFYPGKNLGACGEGGAVSTNDASIAQKIRMLRDHGSSKKYEHQCAAFNFRLEGIQGAVLDVKLKYLNGWNENRRKNAARYAKLLAGSGLELPVEMPGGKHVYHLYVIQTNDRDAVKQELANREIETGLHYPIPLHQQVAYLSLGYGKGDFPVTERVTQRILSLPMYPDLPVESLEYVAATMLELMECQTTAKKSR